jgi:hypothetical protein
MAEESEPRQPNTPEFFTAPDRGPEHDAEQNEANIPETAETVAGRIKLTETERNPNLSVPEGQTPVVQSEEGESVVQVPERIEDPFSEDELMGTAKAPEALALESLLEHELDLNLAADTQEEILDLSQNQ